MYVCSKTVQHGIDIYLHRLISLLLNLLSTVATYSCTMATIYLQWVFFFACQKVIKPQPDQPVWLLYLLQQHLWSTESCVVLADITMHCSHLYMSRQPINLLLHSYNKEIWYSLSTCSDKYFRSHRFLYILKLPNGNWMLHNHG